MTQTRPDAQPRLELTQARMEREWLQQDVANLIGTTGLNVSRWERGITRPGPYFRAKLCKLFGKDPQELDLEPAPAPSEPAAPPSTPHKPVYDSAIPLRPSTRLVGREHELAGLKQRLFAGGRAALTALHGLPGVGKTALTIELAYDPNMRAHFRDGILWAALGPEPSIPTILTRWSTLLGVEAVIQPDDDWERWHFVLHAAIGTRSLLLVIDDAWCIDDALLLTVGGSNCVHLVTTRFPGIAADLSGEGATMIHELGEREGLKLLRILAPRAVDHEEQKARELVNTVGGLPLALTLMGRYLHTQASTGQSWRVAAAFERLSHAEERLQLHESTGLHDYHSSLATEQGLSLQSVFAIAGQQLDNETRDALAALSVFPPKPNSFSEEAALAFAGCTFNTLDALVDAGLLESSAPGRYTLHPVIGDYTRLCLTGTEAQSFRERRRRPEWEN